MTNTNSTILISTGRAATLGAYGSAGLKIRTRGVKYFTGASSHRNESIDINQGERK